MKVRTVITRGARNKFRGNDKMIPRKILVKENGGLDASAIRMENRDMAEARLKLTSTLPNFTALTLARRRRDSAQIEVGSGESDRVVAELAAPIEAPHRRAQ